MLVRKQYRHDKHAQSLVYFIFFNLFICSNSVDSEENNNFLLLCNKLKQQKLFLPSNQVLNAFLIA